MEKEKLIDIIEREFIEPHYCDRRKRAEILLNELIPDGAVVLTKEELEQRNKETKELKIANNNLIFQLQCHDDEVQRLMKENGKLRFERDFAQKIAQKGVAREYNKKMAQEIEYHNFENTSDYEYMNTSNNEILKEFGGVEVEE